MVTAIARTIPKTSASMPGFGAMSSSWRQVDEPDFREGDRARCMSHLTLARIEAWAVAQIDGLAARPPPLATKGEGLNVKYPDVLALCQYVDAGRVDFLV
jgi:hypothetical protein